MKMVGLTFIYFYFVFQINLLHNSSFGFVEVMITRPKFVGKSYLRYNLSSILTSQYGIPLPGYFELALRFSLDSNMVASNVTLIDASSIESPGRIQLVMVNTTSMTLNVSCGSQGPPLLLQASTSSIATQNDAPSTIFIMYV